MSIVRAASLLAFLNLAAASLGAQVVARQGDPAESPLQEFKSPMVLELPLKDFHDLPKGTGRDFKEVRRFYCEDVVLSQLVVSPKKETRRGKSPIVRLDIRGALSVRPSFDRLATLRFDLINGEERFSTTQVPRINAEEGRTSTFSTSLSLEEEEYERFFTTGDNPRLQITVAVSDNS
ncbi:MAG: hypothetical protein QOH06_1619 [Acidobacteriota bacterium]|jgi:hypothetical protein|nr:hypothetical protein [Acidobacteriota bacterium]